MAFDTNYLWYLDLCSFSALYVEQNFWQIAQVYPCDCTCLASTCSNVLDLRFDSYSQTEHFQDPSILDMYFIIVMVISSSRSKTFYRIKNIKFISYASGSCDS